MKKAHYLQGVAGKQNSRRAKAPLGPFHPMPMPLIAHIIFDLFDLGFICILFITVQVAQKGTL